MSLEVRVGTRSILQHWCLTEVREQVSRRLKNFILRIVLFFSEGGNWRNRHLSLDLDLAPIHILNFLHLQTKADLTHWVFTDATEFRQVLFVRNSKMLCCNDYLFLPLLVLEPL